MVDVHIVEDDRQVREIMSEALRGAGFRVREVASGEEAIAAAKERVPDVLVLDLKLPGMDGLATYKAVKAFHPPVIGVILTGYGTFPNCVEAIKEGIDDYLAKPCTPHMIVQVVANAAARRRGSMMREGESSPHWPGFAGIIGVSGAIQDAIRMIRRAAGVDLPVLITGETGTGKELAARAIHGHSKRAAGPLLDLNCAAIPRELFESELFGHERGAFTGAATTKPGKFERAAGGILFLDEVGELPFEHQPKFLRALENGETTRVGGHVVHRSSVRIVAATNAALGDAVKQGRFREDLYQRLKVFEIRLPALRERPEDVPVLTDFFLNGLARTAHCASKTMSSGARAALSAYRWPGNVRELKHALQYAWAMSSGEVIEVQQLPESVRRGVPGEPALVSRLAGEGLIEGADRVREEYERKRIAEALARNSGNRTAAAAELGIDRRTLQLKLVRYDLGSI